ncbi:Zinc finger protein 99 [Armadillidium vulgare]|nr:Zinc finger protein 99 [Armadillidium vulgare]
MFQHKLLMNLICNKGKSLDHNTSDETTTEVLKCLECTFETGTQKLFNLHSQIHVEIKKCTECNFESSNAVIVHIKPSIKNHMIAHCAEHKNIKLFKCDYCDFESNYRKCLIRHSLYRCSKKTELNSNKNCVVNESKNTEFSFLSLSEIILLIFNKRKSLDENGFCSIPYRTFKMLQSAVLKLKIQNQPTSESESAPSSLRKRSKRFNKTLVDISDEEQSEMPLNHKDKDSDFEDEISNKEVDTMDNNYLRGKKKYRCHDCSYTTCKSEDLVAHCLDHADKKIFKCEHCDFKTNYTRSLRNHNLKCLKNHENSLSDCFNRAIDENVNYHSLSLTEMINLICNQDKSLDHNTSDEITTEVLKCLECTFETGNQKIFNLHSQIHVEGKKCTECNFESKDTATFKDHLITHLGQSRSDIESVPYSFKSNKTFKEYISYEEHSEMKIKGEFVSHLLLHNKDKTDRGYISTNFDNLKVYTFSDIISMICNDENECSHECSDISVLNLHSCEPNSDKVFKCLRCNFETKNKKHFTLHSQIHAKLRKCTECDFSHLRPNKFQDHLMTHLPIKLYSCTECGYKTNYINKLKLHLLNHTGMKVFQCSKCDYKTNQKGNLRNHIENHLEVKSFRCSECNYSTRSSRSLKLHILDHSQKKLFLCSECNYGCNDKTRMSRHVLQHSREKLYKCSRCEFETNFMKNLKDHEARRHGGSFSYACSHCEFKCYKRSSLKAHSIIHSNTKLLKCPECNYQCNANLKLHMINMHSKTKMYKCSQCKYEGNHRSNFLTHIRTHSNERKYSCTECNFACNRKDNLKVHMATHLKEKLSCAECSYKCSNKQQLKRHILSH